MTPSRHPPPTIMGPHEIRSGDWQLPARCPFEQNAPEPLWDTATLKPAMHSCKIEVGVEAPRIVQNGATIRPH